MHKNHFLQSHIGLNPQKNRGTHTCIISENIMMANIKLLLPARLYMMVCNQYQDLQFMSIDGP